MSSRGWGAALFVGVAGGLLPSEARGDSAPHSTPSERCAAARADAAALRNASRLRDALQRFAFCVSRECPADVRSECEIQAAQVDAAIPTLVLRVTDVDGADLSSVTVLIDDRPLLRYVDGAATAVDPGEHHLTFVAAGRVPAARTIVAVAGAKGVVEHVVMKAAPTKEVWYGWQTLVVDGASVVTIPVLIGWGGLFLGAPIVHVAHGHIAKGFGDLGMRVGAAGLGILGLAAAWGPESGGTPVGAEIFVGLGTLIGLGVASVVDAAALGWERVPVNPVPLAPVVPAVGVSREHNGGTRTTVGIAGRF